MGNFWDSSEVKCAAGVGLSVLGIGLGVPIAAEGCTEVIKNAEEQIVTTAEATRQYLDEQVCRAPSSIPSYAELLFGPIYPITTLTVPLKQAVCEHDPISDIVPDLLSAALPFMGFGGVLAHSLYKTIQNPPKPEEIFRDFAETLMGSLLMMGATKSLRRVAFKQVKHAAETHQLRFKEFIKINRSLPPELLEELKLRLKQNHDK